MELHELPSGMFFYTRFPIFSAAPCKETTLNTPKTKKKQLKLHSPSFERTAVTQAYDWPLFEAPPLAVIGALTFRFLVHPKASQFF